MCGFLGSFPFPRSPPRSRVLLFGNRKLFGLHKRPRSAFFAKWDFLEVFETRFFRVTTFTVVPTDSAQNRLAVLRFASDLQD